MDNDELKYWIAFNRVPGIGRARFAKLEERFGSLAEAWRANGSALRAAGLDGRSTEMVVSRRPSIDPDAEIRRLEESGARAFTRHDDEYPPRLKEIYDLPPVIYVKGRYCRRTSGRWPSSGPGGPRPTGARPPAR